MAGLLTNVKQLMEQISAGNNEILGENAPQCYFVHHKSHMIQTGIEPGQPQWETGLIN
jgi:hypothetical protein